MKRIFAVFSALAVLMMGLYAVNCRAGFAGYGVPAVVDRGERLAEQTEDGSWDLGENSLTVSVEELSDYSLYTNTTRISVKADGEDVDCTVYLCADGSDLLQFTLEGKRKKTFSMLTSARRYTLRAENADGLTFTVTD